MSFLQKLIAFLKPKKDKTLYNNEGDPSTFSFYPADSTIRSQDNPTPAPSPEMEQPSYDSPDFSIDSTDCGFDGGFDGGDGGAD